MRQSSRSDAAVALGLFMLALAWFSLSLAGTFELRDEGWLLHLAARTAAGEVPHRDFTDVYGPGVHLLGALALGSFDREILALRWELAAFRAAAVAFGFLVTRRFLPLGPAALAGVAAILLWGPLLWSFQTPYAAVYALPLCTFALWLTIYALERRSRALFVAAGAAAALAILFKQSLGAALAFGLGLAVFAGSLLEDADEARAPRGAALAAALFLAGCALLPAPFLARLTPADYALHFLPAQLGLAAAGGAVWKRGSAASLAFQRAALFALGAAAVLFAVGALYAQLGALDALLFDLFTLPRLLVNYEISVVPPQRALALGAGAGLCAIGAGLLALSRRPRAALGCAAVALVLAALVRFGDGGEAFPWSTLLLRSNFAAAYQPAAVTLLAVALFVRPLLRPRTPQERAIAPALVCVLLFQLALSYQIYPRAGYNVFLVQGATLVLGAISLYRLWQQLTPARPAARALAALLVLLVPLWIVLPSAASVLEPRLRGTPTLALALPYSDGLSLSRREHAHLRIDALRRLVERLRGENQQDAPLLLLTNQAMILFLTQRPSLVREWDYDLLLASWNMLPAERLRAIDQGEIVRRLRETRGALVVDPGDEASQRLREALPELASAIDAELVEEARFGPYRMLRRR